ncbi:hemoglobin/transferrin/lactoferrin receptor protein [Tahibacter aquaticus]|uniref:Hemoglobin/transferrin/lactoferrin receptor protein n=1 Tax=Tahibacter aquaticus TaxID=520092 RepID=A0A4R6YVK4_9GAMM|nr:TonB-dependent hemoglobin/transferrin/lactoferrin family receptor [Tahibacter aquaticus]TDR42534.1 hemoglobin/transferrin/lactoferrin receptor protein [Tahibacter aquaticus]
MKRPHPVCTRSLLALAVAASLAASTSPAAALAGPEPGPAASALTTVHVEADVAKAQSATNNVKLIGARQLDDENAQNFDDAVRYIPGVSVIDIGRFGANGFTIRGLESDRVAITVDGLGLGDSLDPASYQPYDFFRSTRGGVDIDALKSVEIIKGADSITAGSGSLGGAVVLVTKDAADYLADTGNDTFASVKAGYSSDSEETLASATLANRSGRVESLLVLTRREGHERASFDDAPAQTGPGRRTPDPLTRTSDNLLAKVDFVLGDAHRLGLIAEIADSTVDSEALSRLDASYHVRTGHDKSDRDRYGVKYEWKAGNRLFDTVEWRYDQQKQDSSGLTYMLFNSSTCPQSVRPCDRTEDRYYRQQLDATNIHFDKVFDSGGTRHTLLYGAGYQVRDADFSSVDTRYVGQTGQVTLVEVDPDFVPKTDVSNWNLYARERIAIAGGRFGLSAGLRYDNYDYKPRPDTHYQDPSGTVGDVSFAVPTWQLGADFKIAPEHTLWAQIGRGFRAPTVEDLYYATSTTPGIVDATGQEVDLWDSVANPDLQAEKSLNTEIGWRWQGDGHLLGVSVYRDRYSNFIEYVTRVRNPGTGYRVCNAAGTTCTVEYGDEYTTPANAGRVIVTGVELEGRWLLNRDLSLRFAYSYNEGEKQNGDPLASIVPASGVLGLRYDAPSRRWNLTGNLTHSAAKQRGDAVETAANGTVTPSSAYLSDRFTVLDILASVYLTEKLKFNAGIYNLLDEEYFRWQRVRFVTNGSGGVRGGVRGDGIDRYSEPGRNVRVSLAYAF